ncbi:uncharacterized protein LOC123514091 [Portunus trituberculatus]|uniref:uncharacterized protein LOC123514091 n=1 Tax=Portunus trituberculatus TaxID=210409 RepID=UPI001E1CE0D9|nr:uncharacterized protein LOC123514091 [Portunus trituberculatus]XP_045127658.1 uncharacterized protein LOC123514091 [Portunus trituberculatus]XP_045127659.1 uncharacterized protein LOC123514091 [Portunus trituberculatus]
MMKVLYALLVVAAAATAGVVLASELSHRDERILFASNPLVCDGDAGHQGACLPYFRCESYGGTVEGTCRVVGQCCVVESSCGETSEARITYFTSKHYLISDTNCGATISPSSSIAARDICQLHVTLEEMTLTEPNADGECDKQYLEVKGGKENSMKVCGVGNNQTLVVDVEGMEGPFKVSVTTLEENLDSEWEVKVVQVPCNSDDLAPSGCHQYVTGVTGEVKSFNYDTKESSRKHANDMPGSRHLQESYTICVRAENDYCGVKWTSPSDSSEDEYDFTLTGNLAPAGMDPVFGSGLNEDCAFTDYLLITDASVVGEEFPTTVLCGSHFPSPGLYSTSFEVRVVANDKEFEDEDIDNRGFHLLYEQQLC